jgi:hypothetical protein
MIVPDPWLQFAGIWPTCFDVVGAPFWKGTTFEAVEVPDPLPAGSTTTWLAVMVVPLVVPRTRRLSPVVMVLADVERVPFSYVVVDVSSMVTFWPADVDIVKPEDDMLVTVPDAPPAAGPDRALEPAPPEPLVELLGDTEGTAVAEDDVARPTETPIAEHANTPATIHLLLLVVRKRRTRDDRVGVLDSGRTRADSWGFAGSESFMTALLLLRPLHKRVQIAHVGFIYVPCGILVDPYRSHGFYHRGADLRVAYRTNT